MGVPTHRVEIRKHNVNHSWANDYLVECPSMDDAESVAELLVAFEIDIHYDNVTFDNARISTMNIGDRVFRHIVINETGNSFSAGLQFLPLFNTLRADLQTLDSDPCRKYYRIPVPESEQSSGDFAPSFLDALNPKIPALLGTFPDGCSIVSNIGHIVINGSFHSQVQMRQLHRHRRPAVIP